MNSPFDDALEQEDLAHAADAYASARGVAGSPEYRGAWLQFRHNIKTIEDLRHARANAALRVARAEQTGAEAEPEPTDDGSGSQFRGLRRGGRRRAICYR